MAKGKGKGKAGDAMRDIGVGTSVKKGKKAMTSGKVMTNKVRYNPQQGGNKYTHLEGESFDRLAL